MNAIPSLNMYRGTVVVRDVLLRPDDSGKDYASVEMYDHEFNLVAMFFGYEARNEAMAYVTGVTLPGGKNKPLYLREGSGQLERL